MPVATEIQRGFKCRWLGPSCAAAEGSLLDRILATRHINDPHTFLNPSLSQLCEPTELPDIDRASERLLHAARAHEPIVVYGDYDVDGITATAILVRMLRALVPGARIDTYVPHRLEEGYGLNPESIAAIAAAGARVIVSVDCGITATEPAKVARQHGIDLIITDHHNPPHDAALLPGAFAIVHPSIAGSACTFRDLCGAGVAYKLAWRMATMACGSSKVPPHIRQLLLDLLGLVALGTVADVVPLVGENRVLTRFGLPRVQNSPFVGLRALVSASGLAGENIDADSVGFRIGPQINACGRLGHAREAVELLLTEDPLRARDIAEQLAALNRQRRQTEQSIVKQACELAESAGMTGPDRRAIVLAHQDWHPGVVGIVCSRLVERFARPTLLLQVDQGWCSGSGRSIDGFNLHAALEACRTHLNKFGGHDMAAGLRLASDRFDAFADAFIEHANAMLSPDDLVRTIQFDTDARVAELNEQNVRTLERLAPFGRSHPSVRLRLRGLRLNSNPRYLGAESRHLALDVADPQSSGGLRLVGWNWGEHADLFSSGVLLDAVVTPKLSTWNGRTRVEPELLDVAIRE